jgi:hypothetical protein
VEITLVDEQAPQAMKEELMRMTQELIGLARRLLEYFERTGSSEVAAQRDHLERLMEMLLQLKGNDPNPLLFILF